LKEGDRRRREGRESREFTRKKKRKVGAYAQEARNMVAHSGQQQQQQQQRPFNGL